MPTEHYMKYKESIKRSVRKYANSERGKKMRCERKKRLYDKDPEGYIKESCTYNRKLRLTLIALLGDRCSNSHCLVPGGCNDIRCLQIDHINGGGYKQLKILGNLHNIIVYYMKHQQEAKQDLQILCANCNWIKRYTHNEFRSRLHNNI